MINKDEMFFGDYLAKQVIEFGLKQGYTREEMQALDIQIDVVKSFAEHLGVTPEWLADRENERFVEMYGITIKEYMDLSREALARGEVMIINTPQK